MSNRPNYTNVLTYPCLTCIVLGDQCNAGQVCSTCEGLGVKCRRRTGHTCRPCSDTARKCDETFPCKPCASEGQLCKPPRHLLAIRCRECTRAGRICDYDDGPPCQRCDEKDLECSHEYEFTGRRTCVPCKEMPQQCDGKPTCSVCRASGHICRYQSVFDIAGGPSSHAINLANYPRNVDPFDGLRDDRAAETAQAAYELAAFAGDDRERVGEEGSWQEELLQKQELHASPQENRAPSEADR